MLSLHMLPALHGDALWLEYGDRSARHRVLIDGGPRSKATVAVLRRLLAADPSAVDLIVVTHIDADHIVGVLEVFQDRGMALDPADVWFNAWRHLPDDRLGAVQAEALTATIEARALPWNGAFGGGAVVVPDAGRLPTVVLPGGMVLTVLSPTSAELAALKPVWAAEVRKAGLVPGQGVEAPPGVSDLLGESELDLDRLVDEPFAGDDSTANGASIAMLAEFEGRSLLLTGDAHPRVLTPQLRRLAQQRGADRLAVDVVKLPHHGSVHNASDELFAAVDCGRWLFSTNGAIYGHPDPTTVARIVVGRPGAELVFNYRAATTDRFDSSRLRRRHRYRTMYPDPGPGIRIDL